MTSATLPRPAATLSHPVADLVTAAPLDPLVEQWAILLKTRKRDGTWVGTPVNVAVDGDRAYFGTPATAAKVKRLRNFPDVEVAPSTVRGRPTGPSLMAHARRLDGEEAEAARRCLHRKYRFVYGALVPLELRIKRTQGVYYALSGFHEPIGTSRVGLAVPVAVVQAWMSAFDRRDTDELFALTSPDLEYARWVGIEYGHNAIRGFLRRQSYGVALKATALRMFSRGGIVVVESHLEGRYLETGEPAGEQDAGAVFVVRKGRVVRFAPHPDLESAFRDSGLNEDDEVLESRYPEGA